MASVAYLRTSSFEQNLDRQDIKCDKLFEEKVSGAATKNRPKLNEMIDYVREGDEVIVWSIDRLARNLQDLQNIIQTLNEKGVTVKFKTENLTFSADSDNPFSKLQLQMMGAFAEFERSMIKKRQAEGIAKAKERGVYKGRKKSIDDKKIRSLKKGGMKVATIARNLGISRMSVYRALSV